MQAKSLQKQIDIENKRHQENLIANQEEPEMIQTEFRNRILYDNAEGSV